MHEPALWMLSINAFAAVLVILGLLAGAIRVLTLLFPSRVVAVEPAAAPPGPVAPGPGDEDAAVQAAIHATLQRLLPGGRVTRVVALPAEPARGDGAR